MKWRLIYVASLFLICSHSRLAAQEITEDAKPFEISGALSVGGNAYSISGAPDRQRPYGWFINLSLTPRVYNFSFPITVVINQQQTLLTDPFTRFGVSPSYKWATLHLGHRNLYFSDFTLSGVTFLGAGLELNPGKFRFGAMYGRFQQAVELTGGNYRQPQFERTGYSVRAGVGTDEEYVDLVFFRAEDDPSSLDLPDTNRTILPQENIALGLTGRLKFIKDKLYWNFDGGLSLFTEDQEAFGTEAFQNAGVPSFLGLNASSHANVAGSTEIGYRHKKFSLAGKFRYVQDGYKSLGLNYLLDDLMKITFNPSVNLLEGKLNISGSYGILYNNLSERLSTTTQRRIGSLNVAWNPGRFGVNVNYSNFTVYQQTVRDLVYNDSLLINQVNHVVNITPYYRWQNDKQQHGIQANLSYQQLADQNDFTSQYSENSLQSVQCSYSLTLLETGWNFRGGLNYNEFSTNQITSKRYGFTGGVGKKLMDGKMNVSTNGFYNINEQQGTDGNITNIQLNVSYSPHQKHTLTFSGNILSVQGGVDFVEQRGSLIYRTRF